MADPSVVVEPARSEQFAAIGGLCTRVYRRAQLCSPGGPYDRQLDRVAERILPPRTQVLVATSSHREAAAIAGTITYCEYGSPFTEVTEPGECEFRMLAVSETFEGQGVARQLISACDAIARERGIHTVVACASTTNFRAQELFARTLMSRDPNRDWVARDGTRLLTYSRPTQSG